mmetsp:Transcript_26037/g.44394  ORF Transcript_26037/g.44394 Transcript_26037/m.44394 type:complete len:247 (-) Transcript_26037:1911-2651(-)
MHLHIPIHISRKRNLLNVYLFEQDWQSAITEIERNSLECQTWSTQAGFFDGSHEARVLPIHIACSLHAPLGVVREIVEAYPDCLRVKESSFKRLPIHVACQFAASPDVIDYLAQEYRAGTLEADILGRLPIHYACSNGATVEVVQSLLHANPASTLYADLNGWLPLHVAVHFGASTDAVQKIIQQCPAATVMKTKKSSTALALAQKVQTKNRQEVVTLLEGAMAAGKSFSNQPPPFVRKMSMAACA